MQISVLLSFIMIVTVFSPSSSNSIEIVVILSVISIKEPFPFTLHSILYSWFLKSSFVNFNFILYVVPITFCDELIGVIVI